MSRQGGGTGRNSYGRSSDAAYADNDAYQRDSYLEADAYPVDPGYRGYPNGRERGRPRPADMSPGSPRPRQDRGGMPPRPGYGRRGGAQVADDPGAPDRPWQRPEDGLPGVGRPRFRPMGPRPRPAGPGPGQQRTAPPRGPRLAASYESPSYDAPSYEADGPGPYAYPPGPEPGYPSYQEAQAYQGQDFRSQARTDQTLGRPGPVPPDGRARSWPPAGPAGPVPTFQPRSDQARPDQYGPGWAGTGQGPAQGQGGPHGQGQPWPQGQPGYGQGQFGPGQPPNPQMGGQYGQQPPNAGSWQAPAGPQPGPQQGEGPGWGPGQGPQGPNVGTAGAWQAAAPAQGQNWGAQQGPYAPGTWQAVSPGFGADPRSAGTWQAAGPEQGQAWPPGPGVAGPGAGGQGNAGPWQAAGPQQVPGWAPGQGQPVQPMPGQYGPGAPSAGPWQANGAAPGQGWGAPAPQPYLGPAQPGQPHAGQYQGAGANGMQNAGGFANVGSPLIRQRDSALPDPQASVGGRGPIAAIETDNIAAFARDLRVLRSKARLDYPEMAERSHYTMRTLASAAGGLRLPALPVLIAYVNACGGDLAEWEERWNKLAASAKQRAAVAVPGNAPQFGQPPQQNAPLPSNEIYVITSARERDGRW